jgi:hypothetical protein
LLLIAISRSVAASSGSVDITLEPVISEAKYCREGQGDVALNMRFILRYRNTSQTTIVLSAFSVLSGYELFSDETALKLNRREFSLSLHRNDVLDARKLDPSTKDPKLFWIIGPGEIASAYQSVSIPVLPAQGDRPSLLGQDRYLRVRMNPWPAERKTGDKLRTLWERNGVCG